MSEQSRKVKNPLLTAAGHGFPFEDYATNALLMPVTPATPVLLPDDSPKESSSGQEPAAGIPCQPGPSSDVGFPVVQDFGPVFQQQTDLGRQQPAQPQRQGYFTSILSSLPNLSLSTITGDAPTSSPNPLNQQTVSGNPGRPGDPPGPHGLAQTPYGPPPTSSGSFVGSDTSREPIGHHHQGFGDVGLAGATIGPPPSRPPPTAATLPPSGGPGSYRLGNQRRLKYAPPPDLTTSVPKQFPTPTALGFLPPAQPPTPATPASDFLIPTATFQPPSTGHTPSPSGPPSNLYSTQIPNSPKTSQTSSSNLSGLSVTDIQQRPPQSLANPPSFSQSRQPTGQYDRPISAWSVTSNSSISAPQEIPSRFPETATPQNTPANVSFVGFPTSYDSPSTLSSTGVGDSGVSDGFAISTGPTKFTEGLTFDVPSSAFAKSNAGAISGAIIEPDISSSTEDVSTGSGIVEDKSFTPISAARVTAKLEHLLAEREEDSSSVKSAVEFTNVLGEVSKAGDHLDHQRRSVTSELKEQPQTSEAPEELADIDLTASDPVPSGPLTQDIRVPFSQAGLDFPPSSISHSFPTSGSHFSEPSETNASSKSTSIVDSFAQNQFNDTVTSAANFFGRTDHGRQTGINYFSATETTNSGFYNPRQAQAPLQSNPSSYFNTVSNRRDNPSDVPEPPKFYDPTGFSTISREPSYSPFTTQISSSGPHGHNPFANVLTSNSPTFPNGENFMATAMPEPSGSATLNPVQMSVNPGHGRSNTDMVPPSLQSLAAGPTDRRMQYRPVYHHWFYRKEVESKILWLPFSMQDSLSLEDVHNSSEITPETTVATDGGRYDVDILRRRRIPVYWTGNPTEVRRSSWFYKGSTESRYIPYEETIAARLEEEYKQACTIDNWNRRIDLNNGEYIVFHSSSIQVHYVPATSTELAASWGNSAGSETGTYLQGAASRPKVVKRGVDEFNIDEGEPEKVDHLLFIVHGIGSVCDLKFRTVEEVVDEFRSISLQLVQSHYRTASTHGIVNRVEVLPISWHTTLHSEDTGIDKKLQAITLDSIPKLRHFTNDTLLDILFYTSPIYCQTIMQTVGNEMNRLYTVFKQRNPNFGGSVYLGGHSLGSLIVFDLLCHQKPPAEESRDETDPTPLNPDNKSDDDAVASMSGSVPPVLKRRLSKKVSYMMGAAGTGQPFINYPQLSFHPQAFFALGSPIGMFVTVRGIDTLGDDFVLPTCPSFFNIFHPFDPVAYRVESLINPESHKYRPMLIPHHKGRKRMHLELKETMARVGADLKQKLMDSVRSTWNSVYQLAMFHRPDNQSFEQEIEKVVEEQMHKSPSVHEQINDDDGGSDFRVGNLNGGRRIDYVLQEAPFEYINEYIFALTSHVCYWESEDTMLMILKEIYGTNGVQADAQLPPQTMTIERVSPSPSMPSMPSMTSMPSISGITTSRPSGSTTPIGINPTAPPNPSNKPVGPPPTSGFVRKS